jgi:hypothetical protein
VVGWDWFAPDRSYVTFGFDVAHSARQKQRVKLQVRRIVVLKPLRVLDLGALSCCAGDKRLLELSA